MLDNEIRHYLVNAQDFFSTVKDTPERQKTFLFNAEECKRSMQCLIERYRLSGKNILSLGSGNAFEEYWFYKSACSLVLNDLDFCEGQSTRPGSSEIYLQKINPSFPNDKSLSFYIGDADHLIRGTYLKPQFDCLYVSSFHPDEVRREKIQEEFKMKRSVWKDINNVTWPRTEKPYLEVLVESTKYLRKSGLAIFQHYRGGVDVSRNYHYLENVGKQFEEFGLNLLEAYCFRRSPQNLLIIGYKGTRNEAIAFRQSLLNSADITEFHGRYPDKSIRTEIEKTFDIASPQLRASPWPPLPSNFLLYTGWVKTKIKDLWKTNRV